jgi:antirestriction protein ArdC
MTMASKPEYTQNLWVTFKQAKALGGSVRKGEKSTSVIFWTKVTKEEAEDEKMFMVARAYHVFNVAQCEGVKIPEKFLTSEEITWTPSEGLERIVAGYAGGPEINHREQARAFYDPAVDKITLPPKSAFDSETGYAETLLHELTHSTGHESRLNRFTGEDKPAFFGSEPYAREELVAELGAMMLMSEAGIEPVIGNAAAYIDSWLKALKDDKNLIIQAAQRAAKATDHILGRSANAE